MDFKIVRATGEDELAVIRDLAIEIWPEVFNSIVPPAQVDFMLSTAYNLEALRRAGAGGEHFHLAWLDGLIVGYLALTDFGDGHGKLNKIYLRKTVRGLGLGRKMLEFAVAWGRGRDLNYLVLNVNRRNVRALQVYREAGWVHFGDELIDIGQGFVCDDHILKFDL
jgi:GNAT superfamily N-acetyltransferase